MAYFVNTFQEVISVDLFVISFTIGDVLQVIANIPF